ncbi:hypothetical protein METBIDRAFT_12473 [Metschnikowia bicuspidata var. bicuspidata NRRL YB-4993]|uniref:Uncharacterized protein n=1 Tax=Metschnikowia bicuspidata var. bicuspidata NRRL YB-4993 TaxID=869754 RepID=A0A1A0H8Z1_9ASCO|nr:hypothetical protein METBIDRAFT_12473 [Metschnikowia bicuspidata var. bicuspidata NRRL YB-4993]OBA20476.1 hypothetical protein METBIDRAFT_12473 [Metschnikowia bicuspidata var. bicuspidata NRRL YB-4993]
MSLPKEIVSYPQKVLPMLFNYSKNIEVMNAQLAPDGPPLGFTVFRKPSATYLAKLERATEPLSKFARASAVFRSHCQKNISRSKSPLDATETGLSRKKEKPERSERNKPGCKQSTCTQGISLSRVKNRNREAKDSNKINLQTEKALRKAPHTDAVAFICQSKNLKSILLARSLLKKLSLGSIDRKTLILVAYYVLVTAKAQIARATRLQANGTQEPSFSRQRAQNGSKLARAFSKGCYLNTKVSLKQKLRRIASFLPTTRRLGKSHNVSEYKSERDEVPTIYLLRSISDIIEDIGDFDQIRGAEIDPFGLRDYMCRSETMFDERILVDILPDLTNVSINAGKSSSSLSKKSDGDVEAFNFVSAECLDSTELTKEKKINESPSSSYGGLEEEKVEPAGATGYRTRKFILEEWETLETNVSWLEIAIPGAASGSRHQKVFPRIQNSRGLSEENLFVNPTNTFPTKPETNLDEVDCASITSSTHLVESKQVVGTSLEKLDCVVDPGACPAKHNNESESLTVCLELELSMTEYEEKEVSVTGLSHCSGDPEISISPLQVPKLPKLPPFLHSCTKGNWTRATLPHYMPPIQEVLESALSSINEKTAASYNDLKTSKYASSLWNDGDDVLEVNDTDLIPMSGVKFTAEDSKAFAGESNVTADEEGTFVKALLAEGLLNDYIRELAAQTRQRRTHAISLWTRTRLLLLEFEEEETLSTQKTRSVKFVDAEDDCLSNSDLSVSSEGSITGTSRLSESNATKGEGVTKTTNGEYLGKENRILTLIIENYLRIFLHLITNIIYPCNEKIRVLLQSIMAIKRTASELDCLGSAICDELLFISSNMDGNETIDCQYWETRIEQSRCALKTLDTRFDQLHDDLILVQKKFGHVVASIADEVSKISQMRERVWEKYLLFYTANRAGIVSEDIHEYTHANEYKKATTWHSYVNTDELKALLIENIKALCANYLSMGETMCLIHQGLGYVKTALALHELDQQQKESDQRVTAIEVSQDTCGPCDQV